MSNPILEAALAYRAAGLSVIPINPKTKRPHMDLLPRSADSKPTWKPFQTAIADEATARQWFTGTDAAVGTVCGDVSGRLLIIDFDVAGFYENWLHLAGDLADGLPTQRTGGGGHQVLMRCPDPGRNDKLAYALNEAEETGREIAIETRAEGGYAVLAPSLHPSGNRYVSLVDNLADVPTISQARADALLAAARKLDQAPKTRQQIEAEAKVDTASRANLNGQASVIEAYNAAVKITDILEDYGYTQQGAGYVRPKGEHASVTINDGRSFHHNTNDPLSNGYWRDAFDVYRQLKHSGDMAAAVKAAAAELGIEAPKHTTNSNGTSTASPQSATSTPARKLLHADELGMLPKPAWLIPGVLPANKISQIFGRPGSGKSHVNLDIALTVAQHAAVVYLAAEDAEDYQDRIPAWKEHHKLGTGQLHFWPEPVNLLNPDNVTTFLAEVEPLQPALIVIDTLANCMVGADENSTQHMGIAIDALNRIRRATEAAILVCHHTGWADQHERGNSSLRGSCRVVMKLAQADEGLLTLTCEKINGAKAFEPRYFRLVPAAESVALVPSSKLTTRDSALTAKHYEILEALSLAIFAGGASHSQIQVHTDMPGSTINKALSKLLGLGYVEASGGRYKHYTITSTGKNELQGYFFSNASSPSLHSDFTGSSEERVNWVVTVPGNAASEFTASSHETSHQDAALHSLHSEFTDSSLDSSLFTSPDPPYRGPGVKNGKSEDEEEPKPALPEVLTLTNDWQQVPDGVAVPPGADIRMDMQSGKNYARLIPGKRVATAGTPLVEPPTPEQARETAAVAVGELTLALDRTRSDLAGLEPTTIYKVTDDHGHLSVCVVELLKTTEKRYTISDFDQELTLDRSILDVKHRIYRDGKQYALGSYLLPRLQKQETQLVERLVKAQEVAAA